MFHFSTDQQGISHITGTTVPHNVTLTDTAGNLYTLSGPSWFGGTGTGPNDTVVFGDTEHFVLHSADGGVYGKVQIVAQMSVQSGTMRSFTFDKGNCEPPAN